MSMPATRSICFMTPAHAGEIRQFAVLRRSVQLFAPGFPHIVMVNREDLDEFVATFRNDLQLEIVTTADILPSDLERRRRKSDAGWLAGRWRRHRERLRECQARQLVRLYALANCSYEAAAFVDADVFISRAASPGDFFVGERLKLFRRRAVNAECLDLDVATHEILGNPLHQITELYDYHFSPACFRKSTAVQLFAQLERRKRSKWVRRFMAQQRPSEYNLLGYAATSLESGAGYQLTERNPDELHHTIRVPHDQVEGAFEHIVAAQRATATAPQT